MDAARAAGPEAPVVAYSSSTTSRRLAEKLGLVQQHRAPDADNPDPDAVRLVYADQALTDEQRGLWCADFG